MAKPALLAKLTAQDGKRDDLLAVIAKMVDYVNESEEGTEVYIAHADGSDENVVWFYEMYSDTDAQTLHGGSDAMKTIGKEMGAFMAARPELIPLEPRVGKGLDF